MTETNTWPGKPGVPLNPEKDGWHWVETEHGLAPWRWKENPESIMWEFGWEVGDGVISSAYFAALGPCTYHNPCLTPDQATALQARVAELGAQNEMLRHATDKLRAMLTKLNAQHEPLQRAFITAVELLNDAALEGKKDE